MTLRQQDAREKNIKRSWKFFQVSWPSPRCTWLESGFVDIRRDHKINYQLNVGMKNVLHHPKDAWKKYVCKPRLYTSSSSLGYITQFGGSTRPNAIDFYAGHEEERKRNERKAINEIATRSQTRQWETKTCQLHNSIQNIKLGRRGPALMSRCVIFRSFQSFFRCKLCLTLENRVAVAKAPVTKINLKQLQRNGLYRMDPSWSRFFFPKIQSIGARNVLTRKWVYGPSDKAAFAFSFCFFRSNDMRVKIGGRISREFHSYPYFRRRCAVPQGFWVENSNGNGFSVAQSLDRQRARIKYSRTSLVAGLTWRARNLSRWLMFT